MPPSIDQYGPQLVQARPKDAPLINPNIASPDAFGAAIAEGVARGAHGLGAAQRIRDEEQARARRTRVISRDNELSEAEDSILYDPASGVMFAQGEGAAKATTDYDDRFNKKVQEIAQTLDDPLDREMFTQAAENRRAATRSRVMSRSSATLRKHEQDTTEAGIIRSRSDALRIFSDAVDNGSPEELARATGVITSSIDRQTKGRHYLERDLRKSDAASADLLAFKDGSDTHTGAIEALVSRGKFKEAQAYFESSKQQIDPDRRDAITGTLKAGGLNQEAQSYADTIFKSGYATTKADADKMVAQIPADKADLRDRTQTKVDQEWARRQVNVKEARGATYERLSKVIDNGGDVEQFLASDPDAASLEQIDKDRLRLTAERAINRTAPPSGSDEYYLLRNAAAVKPDAFINEDLRLYRGIIAKDELDRMRELQADMRGAGAKAAGKGAKPARGILTAEEVGNDVLESIGINPNREDGKLDPRARAFKNQLDRAILSAGGTEELDAEAVRKIANRLVLEDVRAVAAGKIGTLANYAGGGLPGMLFGIGVDGTEKARSFEAPGADRRAYTLQQIPSDQIAKVRAALINQGTAEKDLNEDLIITTYNAAVSKAP